jgi:hypothetical protein
MTAWAGLVAVLAVWFLVGRVVRVRRLNATEAALSELEAELAPRTCPWQRDLAQTIVELDRFDANALRLAQATERLNIPQIPTPTEEDDAASMVSKLTALTETPAFVGAAAGGEQFVLGLLGSADPGAIADTTSHLLLGADDAIQVVTGLQADSLVGTGLDLVQHGQAADIITHTRDAAEHLSHVGDGFHVPTDIHFPWVSLVVSTVREGSRVLDNKLSVERAAAHVAVDVGSKLAGAKAGAAIGSLALPGIGTLVGGIVGAIGGSLVGNAIKHAPLRAAKGRLDAAKEAMTTELRASAERALDAVRETAIDAQVSVDVVRAERPTSTWAESAADLSADDILQAATWDLTDTREQLQPKLRAISVAHANASWLEIVFAPGLQRDALRLLKDRMDSIRTALDDAAAGFLAAGSEKDTRRKLIAIASVPGCNGSKAALLVPPLLRELSTRLETRTQVLKLWMNRLSHTYSLAAAEVMRAADAEARRHRAEFDRHRAIIESVKDDVARHSAALGLAT